MLLDYLEEIFGEDYLHILSSEADLNFRLEECDNLLFVRDKRAYFNCSSLRSLTFVLRNLGISSILLVLFQTLKYLLFNFQLYLLNEDRVFIKTLNGLIVIDFNTNKVKKIIIPIESEPNLILNEENAKNILHDSVPSITGKFVTNSLMILETQFLSDHHQLNFKKWSSYKNSILSIIFQLYEDNGYKKQNPEEVLKTIQMKFLALKNKPVFKKEIIEIENSYQKIIDNYFSKSFTFIYKTHVHGDLMPSNILIKGNEIKIFDWANGGCHNVFYDLMMQEFYWPNSLLWKHFDSIDKSDLLSDKYFKNFASEFCDYLENSIDTTLDAKYIKFNLIICLAEIAIKNAHRHSFNESYHDEGREMLKIVSMIFSNIEKSIHKQS